mmetsp:Transcript_38375/g.90229  ORF Transcript_38375/g.90229 Transcript_38375/m.90229 type:complete len:229 (-) Transcript_38375:20-706(-)
MKLNLVYHWQAASQVKQLLKLSWPEVANTQMPDLPLSLCPLQCEPRLLSASLGDTTWKSFICLRAMEENKIDIRQPHLLQHLMYPVSRLLEAKITMPNLGHEEDLLTRDAQSHGVPNPLSNLAMVAVQHRIIKMSATHHEKINHRLPSSLAHGCLPAAKSKPSLRYAATIEHGQQGDHGAFNLVTLNTIRHLDVLRAAAASIKSVVTIPAIRVAHRRWIAAQLRSQAA